MSSFGGLIYLLSLDLTHVLSRVLLSDGVDVQVEGGLEVPAHRHTRVVGYHLRIHVKYNRIVTNKKSVNLDYFSLNRWSE